MNTTSTFWSRRRNRVIASCAGIGLAGAAVFGVGMAAQAASTSSAISPAASVSSSPSPQASTKSDAARLRQAIHGIRALPVAQRPAAFAKLKADVLAGKYGQKAQHDLAAIAAVVASDPAGMRNGLLRLAAVHPHHTAHQGGSAHPSPSPSASTS